MGLHHASNRSLSFRGCSGFGLGGLVLSFCLAISPSIATADDPWASGRALDDWKSIDQLQNYPYPQSTHVPDFAALSQHQEPLVRAACCMALGREADPKRLRLLTRLLKDDSPVVRRFALEALLRLETPEIKSALLEALGNWEQLSPPLSFAQYSAHGVGRLGLPGWLVDSSTSLADRQRWLADFDEEQWNITFKTPDHDLTGDDGRTTIWATIPAAEFDAAERLTVRLRIERRGGKHTIPMRLQESLVTLREVDFNDVIQPKLAWNDKRPQVALPPEKAVELEATAAFARQSPLPGVYLLNAPMADWPLIVRIRRSRQVEEEIPELIRKSADPAIIKRLGEQRVQAAVPALLGVFTANANMNTFGTAQALARIGDARAVSLLLQFPQAVAGDVSGSTERSLRQFGAKGDPEYQRYILHWKEHLDNEETTSLALSLNLMEARGVAEVDRARSELVQSLLGSIANEQNNKNYGKLAVFRAALPAVAAKHPEQAAAALWALRDRPVAFDYVMNGLRQDDHKPWSAELIGRLVELSQEPSESAARQMLLRTAIKHAPAAVLKSRTALASATEAATVAAWASAAPETIDNTILRLEEYVQREPNVSIGVGLARLHFLRGNYDKCEPLLQAALEQDTATDGDKIRSHYYLGLIHAGRGESLKAKPHFQAALNLMKPGIGYDPRPDQIQARLEELSRVPDAPGVTITRQRMQSPIEDNGYVELTENCAFYLDGLRTLRRWDLLARSETSFGVIPSRVRQIVPVDRGRVFVLFTDGSSKLYREGNRKPEWIGPRDISYWSYLSVSKRAITVADDGGVLHAIATQDGTQLWRQKCNVQGLEADRSGDAPGEAAAAKPGPPADPFAGGVFLQPITGFEHRTWPGLVRQAGALVVIPNKPLNPRQFRCLRLDDGSQQCAFEVDYDAAALAADGERAIAAGSQGQVAAVSLNDGTLLWQSRCDGAPAADDYELNLGWIAASSVAYVTINDRLWAFDAQSGRALWKWSWTPARQQSRPESQHGPYSRLIPLSDRVVWMIDWERGSRPEGGRRSSTDIVVLSKTGKILIHETSPLSVSRMSVVEPYGIVAGDTLLVRYDENWESWLLPQANK